MSAHSIHGMSGQGIYIACAGSVRMSAGMINHDEDKTASDKGTAVHEAGEFAYRTGATGNELLGMKFNGIKLTKPMSESVDIYADQLREYDKPVTVKSYVEQRVCISSIDPERLWGTGDYIGIDYIGRKLIAADYKNGFVTVEIASDQYVHALDKVIKGNAQVVGYALAALDKFNLWNKIDTVETCIIQPNKQHEDGAIRKQTYTMTEMREWWYVYKAAHAMTLLDNAPRNAGKHCKYCKARGVCSTNINSVLNRMKLDTSISHANAEQLIALYDYTDVMRSTLKQIKEEVIKLSRTGHKVPNQKLVKAWKRAVLNDEEAMVAEAIRMGKTKEELYKMEPKSKTEIRKIMGDAFTHKFYKTPEAGLKLVPLTDPGAPQRPDRMSSAIGVFTPIN